MQDLDDGVVAKVAISKCLSRSAKEDSAVHLLRWCDGPYTSQIPLSDRQPDYCQTTYTLLGSASAVESGGQAVPEEDRAGSRSMTRPGEDYIASLDDGRTVIVDGERVGDVAKHPIFAPSVASVARLYDVSHDPANRDLMTYESPSNGQPANLAWLVPTSREDLKARRLAIEHWAKQSFGLFGRSPDHVASFFAGFVGASEWFSKGGKKYEDNLLRYYERARDEDLYLSYAIIHPQVDRTKAPHEQPEEHLYASIVDETDNGVVLRGAQMLGTGSAISNHVFVSCILPLPKGSEDYAISVSVPCGTPGLRIYPRRLYAGGATSRFDYPLSTQFDETDSLIVFDDVHVPWENVFVNRDIDITAAQFHETAAHNLGNTQAQIRFFVKLKFILGLARKLSECSGVIQSRPNQLDLGELAARVAIPEGMVLGAEGSSTIDSNGVARPNPKMLYAAMTLQPRLYQEIIFALREMTGGSMIEVPSSNLSWGDPVSEFDYGRYVRWSDTDSRERVKLLKLIWDIVGSEFASRAFQYEMFYAGSNSVVKGRSFANYPWGEATDLVDECLAGYALEGFEGVD